MLQQRRNGKNYRTAENIVKTDFLEEFHVKHSNNYINDLLKEVIGEAKKAGIPVGKNIAEEVYINSRAVTRIGACKTENKKGTKHFSIEIGSALLTSDEKTIKGVLAHEILHTCDKCNNHGSQWKKYAHILNETYGYNIKRTAEIKPAKYKYKIYCKRCGQTVYRYRKTKVITNINDYRCKCGGKLKAEEVK